MKIPLIILVLLSSLLTSACAELACTARTDVDPYDPRLDKQRCVAEVDKNLNEYEKAKATEKEQQLKTSLEKATKKSLL